MEPLKICGRCKKPIPWDMHFQRKRRYGIVCQRCLNKLWRAKGYQFERSLVKKLTELGFNSDRIPTSASGRVTLPDIMAFHPQKRLALGLECKAVNDKAWTVYRDQIAKAASYLLRHYPFDIERKVGICVKFLLGERCKSPIVIKLLNVSDNMNLEKIQDITVSIESESDMPELTSPTLSRRSRKIRRVRAERYSHS